LDLEQFQPDREQVIERARAAGLVAMICPALSADSSEAAIRLAAQHAQIFAAVGIQPNHCAEAAAGDWDRVVELANCARVVAIGETGLDRHWDFTPLPVQQDYFDRHLRLAQERDLPVIIHCREAEAELMAMLREAVARRPLCGVLHAFSGSQAMAEECLELGLHISFAGAVSYSNKKFQPLQSVAKSIPDHRLLIETDSPYLVPEPLRGKHSRNEPAWIVHTASRLAELRGKDLSDLADRTTANARRLFRIQ